MSFLRLRRIRFLPALLILLLGIVFVGLYQQYFHSYYRELSSAQISSLQEMYTLHPTYNEAIAQDPLFTDACFIGDSFTNGLVGYTKPTAYAIEENGSTISKVLERLDEINETQPTRFFILLGINDLGKGYTPEEFSRQYRLLLLEIRHRFPRTPIYIQTIAPVTEMYSDSHPGRSNEKIAEYNAALKLLSREMRTVLLNPWLIFQEGSSLKSNVSIDGLHLNYASHFVWLEQLKLLVKSD